TTAIVASGPFRFSRNPLYLALTLLYLGLTLAFNTWWGIVVLVPVLIIMHRGVVQREERYLEQKFGETYRQYRSKVRRYLLTANLCPTTCCRRRVRSSAAEHR